MKTITKLTLMFAFMMTIAMSACTTGKTDSAASANDTDSVAVVDSDSVRADSIKSDSLKVDSVKPINPAFATRK